jgi:hypothetical protein
MVVWTSEFRTELMAIFMNFLHHLNIIITNLKFTSNTVFSDSLALRTQAISTAENYSLLLNISSYSESQ